MKFREFKNKYSVEELLTYLDILVTESIPFEIEFSPDYDISSYKREITDDYYFRNSFDFGDIFKYVIKGDISEPFIFPYDNLQYLENDNEQGEIIDRIKNILKNKTLEEVEQYTFPIDLDEFKLNTIRNHSIDNINKEFIYEGSFFGDNSSIGPIDWSVISFLNLLGIKENNNHNEFYKSLLAESFVTFIQGNTKISYFLLFTSLENFINTYYEPEVVKKSFWSRFRFCKKKKSNKRLSEKLRAIFIKQFGNISEHKIYNSIIGDLKKFTDDRNIIAHGLRNIEVSKEIVENNFYMVLTAIICYKNKLNTFAEMNNKITVANKKYSAFGR